MDESGSPKKKGRPSKYATQEERRFAKTAQRREQRHRQRGPAEGNVVGVDPASTSMYIYFHWSQFDCTSLTDVGLSKGTPWQRSCQLLFLRVKSNSRAVRVRL